MGVLQGKQFFSWEILPVLEAAKTAVFDKVESSLDSEPQPGDDLWSQLLVTLTRLKIDANTRASNDNIDKTGKTPSLYRAGTDWWKELDAALSTLPIPNVMSAIDELPNDLAPPAARTVKPALVLGALAALAVGGYFWTRR